MKIDFHPDAIKSFNERANELLFCLHPKEQRNKNVKGFDSGVIAQEIKKEDMLSFGPGGEVDFTGKPVSMFFEHKKQNIGLFKSDFVSLLKLSEDIQRAGKLYNVIGVEFIYKSLFAWMQGKYQGITNEEMFDWFVNKCEQEIKIFEVWIPIAHTIIEVEFEIGEVKLKNFSKEILDIWERKLLEVAKNDEHKESIKKIIEKERKEKQGRAIAVVKIEAEKNRAEEIVFEKVEEALSVLRLFSPSMLFINIQSYTTVKGRENLEQIECYILSDDTMVSHSSSFLTSNQIEWVISKNMINEIQKSGLNDINQILINKERNSFQEKILNSVLLLSKSTLMSNVSDKLVYIFTALESILLRNETEPIQQNIADRIAFAISQNGTSRMTIVKIIKASYLFRSKYIHHGLVTEEIETLNEFIRIASTFIFSLISNCNNFKTKEEMITAIEKMKYGAK